MSHRTHTRTLLVAAFVALGAAGCSTWNHHADNDHYAKSASNEHRTPVRTGEDAAITAKVKTAFAADETVKARRIDVDTMRGVVTLHGTVNSAAEKDRAISLARNVKGVTDVKDDLRVAG